MNKKTKIYHVVIITLLVAIAIVSCNSCASNPARVETEQGYWNKFLFRDTFQNYITIGRTVNHQFVAMSFMNLWFFDDFETFPTQRPTNAFTSIVNQRPVMSDEYVAYFTDFSSESASVIVINRMTSTFFNPIRLTPSHFGEKFQNHRFYMGFPNAEFGVFNDNRFVTIMRGPVESQHLVVIAYIDIEMESNGDIFINNTGYWTKDLMQSSGIDFWNINVIQDNIYVSFYRHIRPTGAFYIKISPGVPSENPFFTPTIFMQSLVLKC